MQKYLSRAISAYWRDGQNNPDLPKPSDKSNIQELEGKYYVVLRNENGILAIYRITTSGQLKKLKRWPKELDLPYHDSNQFHKPDYQIDINHDFDLDITHNHSRSSNISEDLIKKIFIKAGVDIEEGKAKYIANEIKKNLIIEKTDEKEEETK